MKRYKNLWLGQKTIRKHIALPENIYKAFKEEAENTHGGNHSLLLKEILAERYHRTLKNEQANYT